MSLRALVLLGLVWMVGCGGNVPGTAMTDFAQSVTKLKTYSDNILKAAGAGKLEDAHDDLHEIGHVLESLEGSVDKLKLPEDKLAGAKKAISTLFDSFSSIDETMHDESKSVDVNTLKPTIESALGDLLGIAGVKK